MNFNQQMLGSFQVAVLSILLCLSSFQASAATIEMTPEPIMGCSILVSGQIETGDTERLRPYVEKMVEDFHNANSGLNLTGVEPKMGRVCFDSPGGSLVEGVAIAKFLNDKSVGTAVGRGKICLSACAVAFMGGQVSYENDVAPQPERVLHPLGKLGFHSPDLGVPAGQYDEAVVKKAYLIALESVSRVLDVSPQIHFPLSLSSLMLATPADKMHIISTVAEAARWRIAIAPVVEPETLTAQGLENTCGHIDQAALDYIYDPSEGGWASAGNVTVQKQDHGEFLGEMEDGFRQEAGTGCTVSFRPLKPGQTGRSVASGFGMIGTDAVDLYPYQTYSGDTLIVSLALEDDNNAETRAPQARVFERQMSGRCIVLKGTDIADNEPCDVQRIVRLGEDLGEKQIDTFIWPSGGKTVVESQSNSEGFMVDRLNGVDTERDLDYKKTGLPQRAIVQKIAASIGINDPMIACWPNPSTGNRFCFLDKQSNDDSQFFVGFEN